MLLEVKDVTVCYDTAMLLNGVSLQVEQGEFVSLVGPNGAGKTTLLRTISGLVAWEREMKKGTKAGNITIAGEIFFEGKPISRLPAHNIARMGLVLCPERRRPFTELTVYDNLIAGAYRSRDKRQLQENLDFVYQLFPILRERSKQVSGTMSGGEQQMLAIGRALMTGPHLLCIDEPSTGLAPLVKKELFKKIREINQRGITMLLVEQDVSSTLAMSDRSYILSHSRIVTSGPSKDLLNDDTVRQSYLGL